VNEIARLIKISEELKEAAGPAARPCVAILGSCNAGKSTLLNRLLEDDVSPVGILPTTSCLLHFDYGSTFKATFTGLREKKTFQRREQLHSFLTQLKSPGGRVDVQLPSPLLKKCRLVDTPGIDSGDGDPGAPAEEAAAAADKIIYLFHQRGMEEQNRLFLHRLAAIWKKRNPNGLSFWLNCNLGKCDGTSLEATGKALAEIFPGMVRLHAINTARPEDVSVLRLFLEAELARDVFRQAYSNLKKLDAGLPRILKKAAVMKD